MAKITLKTVLSGFNLNTINENFQAIATEFQNEILYRDNPTGEPNQLETQLDANGQRIINIVDAVTLSEPVTLRQLTERAIFSVSDTKYYDNVSLWQADTSSEVGNIVVIKGRANATFDVISGTGSANPYNILAHGTLSLSIQLREGATLDLTEIGLTPLNDLGVHLTHALTSMTAGRITAPYEALGYIQTTGVIEVVTRDIVLDFNNSEIDATAITSSAISSSVIKLGGSEEAGTALDADISLGQGSLTTSEPLVKGDWFYLDSTTLWSEDRPVYTKGEICKVSSVSGTTIGLEWDLFDSYLAATTTVKKLNLPVIEIAPFTMLMAGDQTVTGVYVDYSENPKIDRTIMSGTRGTCARMNFCINGSADSLNHTSDFQSGDGLNYGLFLSSCFGTHTNGGVLTGGRHGYTTGGIGIPTRNCNVNDLTTAADKAAGTAGFDQHTNNEGSRVIGNTMLSGIHTNASNYVYDDNDIYNGANDFTVEAFTPRSCEYKIFGRKNRIFNNHSSGDAVRLSFIDKDGGIDNIGLSVDNLDFDFAHLDTVNSGFLIQARTISSNQGFKRLRIGGDYMTNGASGGKMIELKTDLTDLNIETFVNDTKDMRHNANDTAVSALTGQGVIDKAFLNANLTKSGTGFGLRVSAATNVSSTVAYLDGGGTGSRNEITGATLLKFAGNIVTGWTSLGGITTGSTTVIAYGNGGDEAFMNGANFTDAVRFSDVGRRVVMYDDAAPVSGTHSKDDVVWRRNASAGSNMGWYCDVAGTPGTWIEFGPIKNSSIYTPTNVSADRAFDADTVAIAELADVVGTLIADLQTSHIIS